MQNLLILLFKLWKKFTKKFITRETLHLTCIDEDNLMLWDKKIYLLEYLLHINIK